MSLKDQIDQDDDPTLGSGKIVPDLAKLWRKICRLMCEVISSRSLWIVGESITVKVNNILTSYRLLQTLLEATFDLEKMKFFTDISVSVLAN